MKLLLGICFILTNINTSRAQPGAQNIFIITIDGVRWQEIFKGADSVSLRNPRFVKDSALMLQQFGIAIRKKPGAVYCHFLEVSGPASFLSAPKCLYLFIKQTVFPALPS